MMTSVSDSVENIVGKGKKCWLPAFSPFPTMFSRAFFFRVVKTQDCVVKSEFFSTQSRLLITLRKKLFENNEGKRVNPGTSIFSFSNHVSTLPQTKITISATLDLSSAISLNLVKAKILSFGLMDLQKCIASSWPVHTV